jgi:hypothetical protein
VTTEQWRTDNLIVRREETAAMRSQADTAKLLEGNPTLMRLRELEVLEKVAAKKSLSVASSSETLLNRFSRLWSAVLLATPGPQGSYAPRCSIIAKGHLGLR